MSASDTSTWPEETDEQFLARLEEIRARADEAAKPKIVASVSQKMAEAIKANPRSVRCFLCKAKSTVHAVLDRHGLVKRARMRKNRANGTPLSAGANPNDLWCTDFKGEFKLGASLILTGKLPSKLPPAQSGRGRIVCGVAAIGMPLASAHFIRTNPSSRPQPTRPRAPLRVPSGFLRRQLVVDHSSVSH
jgi:hypothetical protein